VSASGYEPGTGRLATVTAPGAGLAYAYDGALLLSETWSGSVQGDVAWTYDHDFRITNESVRGGLGVAFGYDQDGLLLSAGATTFTRAAATGLLESATVGSVGTSFGYNGFGELTSHATTVGGTPVYAATLGRDAGGRIQQQTEVLGGVTTTDVYGYDAAGRLETVTRNGTLVVTYGYDANGNRTAVTTAGGTTSATFDAQDRILTFGTRTYTHTPHGDVAGWTDSASSTTTTLTYDVQGNLRQVQQPGTTISYTVDGRNRRIGTAVNGVPVQGFLWQGQLRPVAELDGNGALVSRFVYGTRINVPEYLERGGTTYRLVTDHLGSVRLVIDTTTDQVVQALAYDPWGVVMQDTNPGFQPFGYAGGLYDYRTGLVRFGVRDYDSTIGRWLAKDPIGFGDGGNLYAYVGGDPQNQIDPLGLIRIKVGGYVIQVNKTDADPFPSNPHGHLYPGREKVNVFTGEILDGRNVVGKLPAKHLQVLQSRLKKAGMIGLVLTTLAVADAVALDCGTVGVNTQRAAAGAVGGFAGGWAGAEAGAWLGGALGTAVVPGIGTSVGALVGGVVGGVFGAGVGAEAGTFYVP
jgi:RHS repeat-associated protein